MSAIPNHAELTEVIGCTFTFANEQVGAVEARLLAAPVGTPMDDEFFCYSAHFELPPGIRIPQDTYRVRAPDGNAWDLFATPTRPTAHGAGTMCIVIHRAKTRPPQEHTSSDTQNPAPA